MVTQWPKLHREPWKPYLYGFVVESASFMTNSIFHYTYYCLSVSHLITTALVDFMLIAKNLFFRHHALPGLSYEK